MEDGSQSDPPARTRIRLDAILAYSDTGTSPREYIKDLLENWRSATSSVAKAITLLLLLAALFEMLARAAITKVSVGPFEVGDLALIQKALPAIIAYQFYDLQCQIAYITACGLVSRVAMERYYPELINSRLDYFLLPRNSSLLGSTLFADHMGPGHSENWNVSRPLTQRFSLYMGFVIILYAVLFEIYAYWRLFTQFSFRDPIVWATLLLSFFFVIYALIIFFGDVPRTQEVVRRLGKPK